MEVHTRALDENMQERFQTVSDSIAEELLNQCKDDVNALSSEVKNAQSKAEQLLERLSEDVRRAYDNATQKAKNLEDQTFQSLIDKAEQALQELGIQTKKYVCGAQDWDIEVPSAHRRCSSF